MFSTLAQLINYSPQEICTANITVNFVDERGIDAGTNLLKYLQKIKLILFYKKGGLIKEWVSLFTKEVFDPRNGFFELSPNKICL